MSEVKPRRSRPDQFNTRLPPQLRHRLRVLAAMRSATMAEIVVAALEAYLNAAECDHDPA